jgi:hypothetical protein
MEEHQAGSLREFASDTLRTDALRGGRIAVKELHQ